MSFASATGSRPAWRTESACGFRRGRPSASTWRRARGSSRRRRWRLVTGAVYIDSERESPSLEVQTTFAAVRDVGTQFEVRVGTSALRVRVRSGVVEVRRGTVLSSARPGTELTVDSRGVLRRAFAPYGPEWAWAAGIGPGFAIEGRPLSGFLDHLCREHGWTLAYADAALAHAASRIILHGSIEGLQPSDALDMVLATSGLTRQWNDGELLVTRNPQR